MGKNDKEKINWIALTGILILVITNIFLTGRWYGVTDAKLDSVQNHLTRVQNMLERHLDVRTQPAMNVRGCHYSLAYLRGSYHE